MRKLTVAIGLLMLPSVLLAACGDDDDEDTSGGGEATADPSAQTVEVVAANFAFEPAEISAEPGQAISIDFTNNDSAEHSFTIDDLDVDIESEGGEEATAEFTAPDESVEFFCRYHPTQMRGMIEVSGDAGAAPGEEDSSAGDFGY
jgi:plastocyanin